MTRKTCPTFTLSQFVGPEIRFTSALKCALMYRSLETYYLQWWEEIVLALNILACKRCRYCRCNVFNIFLHSGFALVSIYYPSNMYHNHPWSKSKHMDENVWLSDTVTQDYWCYYGNTLQLDSIRSFKQCQVEAIFIIGHYKVKTETFFTSKARDQLITDCHCMPERQARKYTF